MAIAFLGYKVNSREVEVASGRLDRMSGAAALAGRAAGALTVAMAGIFAGGAIVREIAGFETSMSAVAAVTRATDGELSTLRETAIKLGASTEFSAAQAADGLKFLGMAGFEANEAVKALPATIDLATASGMGLAQAADTASNIMSGFGIEAANAADVADVLAAASSSANTDVLQLGSAMSKVAPVSKSLGVSLETTAASIGIMSDAGLQGEVAGTALRGILASLAGPTAQARDALAKYGLTAEDVNPQTNDLADIMAKLRDRGLDTADAMQIFGREASAGALVMVAASGQIADFSRELEGAGGAAARMAETMRDNLGGDINQLRSAISGIILALGDGGLTSALRLVVQALTSVATGITWVINKIEDFRGYIIAGAVALTASYIPALVRMIAMTRAAVVSQVALEVALGATSIKAALASIAVKGLSSAFVFLRGAIIATGIGALVVGAGMLINEFIKLSEKVGGVSNAFVLLRDVAWESIQRVVDAYWYMKAKQAEVMDTMWNAVKVYSGKFVNAIVIKVSRIAALYFDLYGTIATIMADMLEPVKGFINPMIGAHVGAFKTIVATFKQLPAIFAGIGQRMVNGLIGKLEGGLGDITAWMNKIPGVTIPAPDFSGWKFPESEIANLGDIVTNIGGIAKQSLGVDYVGALGEVGEAGQKTAASLRANADLLQEINNAPAGEFVSKYTAQADKLAASLTAPLESVQRLKDAMSLKEGTEIKPVKPVGDDNDDGDDKGKKRGGKKNESGFLSNVAKAADDVKDKLADAEQAAQDFAKTMAGKVTSGMEKAVDYMMGGFKNGLGGLVDIFKNTIKDMIAYAIKNKITVYMQQAFGGGSGGGGGLVGIGKSLGGIGKSFMGSIGGAGGLLGGASSVFSGVMSGGLSGGFSAIGSALGGATTGIAGFGAALGAVALPLAAVAGVLSFFKKKTKVLDSGLRVTVDGFDSAIESFKKIQTTRFWGLSKKVSEDFSAAAAETADPISDAIGNMQSSIVEAARVFGHSADIFDGFSHQFKLSLKGMDEESQFKAIQDELAKMGDSFASLVPNFENMNDLLNAANQAVKETAELGSTRFESQVLAAARRRGEITTTQATDGFNSSQSLLRVTKLEDNTLENNRLVTRLLNIFDNWDVNGMPLGENLAT